MSENAVALISTADLNTTVNHEPRIEDVRLGEALGFDRPRKIKDLIERHREALERFGSVCPTVGQTSAKGGRPGKTYWLNKRQALFICTKAETPNATGVTIRMVEVYDEFTAEHPEPAAVIPDRNGLALFRVNRRVVMVDTKDFEPDRRGKFLVFDRDGRAKVMSKLERDTVIGWKPPRSAMSPWGKPGPGDPVKTLRARNCVQVIGRIIEERPLIAAH